ncbi:hypothetical protein [Oceanimonas baumannii]|uniref:hypothetical protein n=1 Tax=Oceanimonas baumannii TaxID=129578 RepID=UPI003A91CE99
MFAYNRHCQIPTTAIELQFMAGQRAVKPLLSPQGKEVFILPAFEALSQNGGDNTGMVKKNTKQTRLAPVIAAERVHKRRHSSVSLLYAPFISPDISSFFSAFAYS